MKGLKKSRVNVTTQYMLVITIIMSILQSCEVVAPETETFDSENTGVHIQFNGIDIEEGIGSFANFSFINDSTESVKYFAYDTKHPLYGLETLSDTGWTHFGGWCGTGADYFILAPESSFEFITHLPDSSCTWRVSIEVTNLDQTHSQLVTSNSLVYTRP